MIAHEECLPRWEPPVIKDPGLALFGLARPLLPPIPAGGSVLEIGCSDTDWAGRCKKADPLLSVTAIDWRKTPDQPGVTVEQGDILTRGYEPESFDAVVSLSAIEHIGLGHYKHDPVNGIGDVVTIALVRNWLKPGGWCYFDVPYDPRGYRVSTTEYRAYDDAAIVDRFGPDIEVLGFTTHQVDGWIDKPTKPAGPPRHFYYVALLLRRPA